MSCLIFAAECWLQAEGDISYDDLFARLAEIFEGPACGGV